MAAVIYSILNEEPQRIGRYNSQVSGKLEEIVFKALAKDREERYQHIDDLMADLKHERRLLDTTRVAPGVIEPRGKKKRWPAFIPALAIFVLVLALLIFKAFQVEIGPQRGVMAEENSLAIMYFENVADPQDSDRIAQMITSLLITDLSESQYMRVVSRQRLYDILRLLGKEDLKIIDKSVASEVAERAGVKWILTGSILQTEPYVILTSEISDASSGKILTSQRVAGEEGEDFFSVVDRLSVQTKLDLSLPEGAREERDRAVADVTTHSPEAYRYYLEGQDYNSKLYVKEAKKSFQEALRHDSTFAMAYFRLALLTDGQQRDDLIAKALQYSAKISQKEKHYLNSWQALLSDDFEQGIAELEKVVQRYPEEKEAHFWLGTFQRNPCVSGGNEQAVRHLNKAIEIDPLYKTAYNILAYTYNNMGDFEKSIWAINKYISLAPDEANPYDSRADLYAYNGKIDQAIESY
ncbi:hypothetical protein KAX22_02105, partial [bacterium]|nr:hypothetical protein [bacterium]